MIMANPGLERIALRLFQMKPELDRSRLQQVAIGIAIPRHHVPDPVGGDRPQSRRRQTRGRGLRYRPATSFCALCSTGTPARQPTLDGQECPSYMDSCCMESCGQVRIARAPERRACRYCTWIDVSICSRLLGYTC